MIVSTRASRVTKDEGEIRDVIPHVAKPVKCDERKEISARRPMVYLAEKRSARDGGGGGYDDDDDDVYDLRAVAASTPFTPR